MRISHAFSLENCANSVSNIRWEMFGVPDGIAQSLEAARVQLIACAALIRDELDRPNADDIADSLQKIKWAGMSDRERDAAIREALK